MLGPLRRRQWRLLGARLLGGLLLGAWLGLRWPVAVPGSSEDVFARVRIGMSQDEAVAVLQTYRPGNIDGRYSKGTTAGGRSWVQLEGPSFEDLPPPQDIAHGVLTVCDNDGQEVEVILGPGGVVSAKRLSPGVWQYRLEKACHAAARARTDLLSASWWGDQLHKARRSLRRRWHYAAPCLAAGLLLASVWALRRRMARGGLSRAQAERPMRAEPGAAADGPRD